MTAGPITIADFEAHTGIPGRMHVQPLTTFSQETKQMLLYEELSRARIRELHEDVRAQRIRGSERARRRWNPISRWVARRARPQEQK